MRTFDDKNTFKFIRVRLRYATRALSPSRAQVRLIDFHCTGNVRIRDKSMKFVPARTTSLYMIITITVKPPGRGRARTAVEIKRRSVPTCHRGHESNATDVLHDDRFV